MGEFEIIDRIRGLLGAPPGDVVVGSGDDCACVECGGTLALLTDDAMVEDVHFTRAILDPRSLGRRAATIAISDIAAMGGTPRWLLAAVGAPEGSDAILVDMASGFADRAGEFGAALVGGNLTRSPVLQISVTAVGTMEARPLLRSGAGAGDLIALTGPVGGAALGLSILLEGRGGDGLAGDLARMWRDPPARVEAGRALGSHATAAIDLSDGLLMDLGHVMQASGAGARIDLDRIPLPAGYRDLAPPDDPLGPALRGGEDYELLVALPPARVDGAEAAARSAGCDLHVIGEFTGPQEGLVLVHGDGREERADPAGWDHFRERKKA